MTTFEVAQINTVVSNDPGGFLLEEEPEEGKNLRLTSPVLNGRVEGKKILLLVDSGSEINCISEEVYKDIQKTISNIPELPMTGVTIKGAIGTRSKKITRQVYLRIQLNGVTWDVVFLVIPGLVRDAILGTEFLHQNQATIQFEARTISLMSPNGVTVTVPWTKDERGPDLRIEILETEEYTDPATGEDVRSIIDEKVSAADGINEEERRQLKDVLQKNINIFTKKPGSVTDFVVKFEVSDETPFCIQSYPVPFAKRPAVEDRIKKMEEWGVVRRASTPYISPILPIFKKDGSVRICLDARHLNERIVMDRECPPPPGELLQRFLGMKILSCLDLTSSFWQLKVAEECQKYLGFLYGGKCYVFTHVPFGLNIAVAMLLKCLDQVLGPELRQLSVTPADRTVSSFSQCYVDDQLIASSNFQEHLKHLDRIFTRFSERNVTVNLRKCHFIAKEVRFLGYLISGGGVRPDPKDVQPILDFPDPKNIKMLRRFIGMCGFYTQFRKGAADVMQPLYELTKKGAFQWNDVAKKAMAKVKESFLKAIMLTHPDPSATYYLQTDSSEIGLGAELYQKDEEGNHRTIGFASRVLQPAERNYTTTEKEALAIVWALAKFRTFVIGVKLVIVTDHRSLTFLKQCKLHHSRLARWILWLQQFQFEIQHCSGSANIVSDTLSRYPVGGSVEQDDEEGNRQKNEYYICYTKIDNRKPLMKKLKDIKRLQEEDNQTRSLASLLQENDKKYVMVKGILHKINSRDGSTRIVIPHEIRADLVKYHHEEMGHFGAHKILYELTQRYYWPKMRRFVRQICAACDLCQKTKVPKRKSVGPYSPITPSEVGELVAIDLHGPVPTGSGGAKFILVILDVFSKFVQMYPLRRATALACVRRVLQFRREHVPEMRTVLTDLGTQFTAERWQSALRNEGVTFKYCSKANPEGNPVERVMRELNRFLRAYCHQYQHQWTKWLPKIVNWINSAVHSSTGFPPIKILYGRNVKLTFDDLLPAPRLNNEELDSIRKRAAEVILHKAEYRKKQQKQETVLFNRGQLVLVKYFPPTHPEGEVSRKFFHLFEGPYLVDRVVGSNVYELRDRQGEMFGKFNARHLIPYVSPQCLDHEGAGGPQRQQTTAQEKTTGEECAEMVREDQETQHQPGTSVLPKMQGSTETPGQRATTSYSTATTQGNTATIHDARTKDYRDTEEE